MASQTPNINLTLPTGAEKVSRQIINDNNTKIDTAIGTLNSNVNDLISNTSFGQYGSRELAAKGIYNGMSNGTIKFGTVGVTGISNYLFIAFRNDSTKGIIMMLNQGNIIRMLYTTDGNTFTEKSLTAS